MSGRAFRWTNPTLAFLPELCALGALGYRGLRTEDRLPAKAALGLAAPRAPVSSAPLELGTRLAVFGSAALAPYATGHGRIAVTINGVLVRL